MLSDIHTKNKPKGMKQDEKIQIYHFRSSCSDDGTVDILSACLRGNGKQ